MSERSTLPHRAIVLGGGGSHGAYQTGVWRALEELQIGYNVVTGTSVGALNGVLMAQRSFQSAYDYWWNLDNESVLKDVPNLEDHTDDPQVVYRAFFLQMLKNKGVNITPLETTMRALINEDVLRSSDIDFGTVTVDSRTLKPIELFVDDMPPNSVADYVIASSSFFPALSTKEINGVAFMDGGYHDNIPTSLALRSKNPIDEIIVVDVHGLGRSRHPKTDIPIRVIKSYWDLGSMLMFEQASVHRNIMLGYHDGLKFFEKLEGRAYTFEKGETALLSEKYLASFNILIDQCLAQDDGPAVAVIKKWVSDRLVNAVSRRRTVSTPLEILLASAETAGELFELDPTEVYTTARFNLLLTERFSRARENARGFKLTPEVLKKGIDLSGLAGEIRTATRDGILTGIFDILTQYRNGQNVLLHPRAIALAAPKEFLAALYFCLIFGQQKTESVSSLNIQ